MAPVGLVRVSTKGQDTQRKHNALDPICVKVCEAKVCGKLAIAERPGLVAALDCLRTGDMLAVQEVNHLGRNLLENLIVLTDLGERGTCLKCSTASPQASTPNAR